MPNERTPCWSTQRGPPGGPPRVRGPRSPRHVLTRPGRAPWPDRCPSRRRSPPRPSRGRTALRCACAGAPVAAPAGTHRRRAARACSSSSGARSAAAWCRATPGSSVLRAPSAAFPSCAGAGLGSSSAPTLVQSSGERTDPAATTPGPPGRGTVGRRRSRRSASRCSVITVGVSHGQGCPVRSRSRCTCSSGVKGSPLPSKVSCWSTLPLEVDLGAGDRHLLARQRRAGPSW